MTLCILPLARQDILDHIRFLVEAGAPGAADRFIDAIESTFSQLRSRPAWGLRQRTRLRSLQNLYKWPVHKFRVVWIYYQLEGTEVKVVRILHGKRNVRKLLADE